MNAVMPPVTVHHHKLPYAVLLFALIFAGLLFIVEHLAGTVLPAQSMSMYGSMPTVQSSSSVTAHTRAMTRGGSRPGVHNSAPTRQRLPYFSPVGRQLRKDR